MKNRKGKITLSSLIIVLLVVLGNYFGLDSFSLDALTDQYFSSQQPVMEENQTYTDPLEVTTYIEDYGTLPPNFITKEEAEEEGWIPSEGNLHEVAPGMSIGGDYFGNFEGHLPEEPGRTYYEADMNYTGGHRNGERLVFSNDGLYFYTDDHYESFTQLE